MRWKIIVPGLLVIAAASAGIAIAPATMEAEPTSSAETETTEPKVLLDREQYVTHDDPARMEFFFADFVTTDMSSVLVEATWHDGTLDVYDDLMLYVRTAASREARLVGPLTPLAPMEIPVTGLAADRDGQSRSAWSLLIVPEGDGVRFGALVSVAATSVPGHATGQAPGVMPSPDTLLSVRDSLLDVDRRFQVGNHTIASYDERSLTQYFLEPGARVEPGTERLTVQIHRDSRLSDLRLGYMDAASTDWHWISPDAEHGFTLTYVIDVAPYQADAPGIPTGLWRFTVDAPGLIGGDSGLLGGDLGATYEGFTLHVTT